MIDPVKISVTWEFRDYIVDKRDHKRIRFLNFSSDYGDFKVELPYKTIKTKEWEYRTSKTHKFQEPTMEEILQHCMKMAEDGNDIMKDTFEDVIDNESDIIIDEITIEWDVAKQMLLNEEDNS